MLKFTEKLGKYELSYEGETVQEIINLKQAINPSHLSLKDDYDGCSYAKDNTNIRAQIACDRMSEVPPLRKE